MKNKIKKTEKLDNKRPKKNKDQERKQRQARNHDPGSLRHTATSTRLGGGLYICMRHKKAGEVCMAWHRTPLATAARDGLALSFPSRYIGSRVICNYEGKPERLSIFFLHPRKKETLCSSRLYNKACLNVALGFIRAI